MAWHEGAIGVFWSARLLEAFSSSDPGAGVMRRLPRNIQPERAISMALRSFQKKTEGGDLKCRGQPKQSTVRKLHGLLAAPQGFEPRYPAPEAGVLPLNEGAV